MVFKQLSLLYTTAAFTSLNAISLLVLNLVASNDVSFQLLTSQTQISHGKEAHNLHSISLSQH